MRKPFVGAAIGPDGTVTACHFSATPAQLDPRSERLISVCGAQLIEAWGLRLLDHVPVICEAAELHAAEDKGDPVVGRDVQARFMRCPYNLFIAVCGRDEVSAILTAGGTLRETGRRVTGILPLLVSGIGELSEADRFAVGCEAIATIIDQGSALRSQDGATDTEKADRNRGSFAHSPGFHSVKWRSCDGEVFTFSFTQMQATAVRCLFQAVENGTPELTQMDVLSACESSQEGKRARLNEVFEKGKHPAWRRLIIPGSRRGTYRLNL